MIESKVTDLNYELLSCFHRPLYIFERTLRERIDQSMAQYLDDEKWLINHAKHPIFSHEHTKIFETLIKAELKATIHIEQNRLLQQLHLLDLINFYFPPYGPYYHTTISSHYPFLDPKKCRSSYIISKLFKIRDIRNSVYHNNEIAHDQNLSRKFHRLIEFIQWMTGEKFKAELNQNLKNFEVALGYVKIARLPVEVIEY
jgi:hypothetical protein